tara:strand:+ start:271 stop:561 length:291 start_codon:yes stop_codon:yes gene_type:complete
MKLVPIGKYKIAYWSDGDLVSSEMFESLKQARLRLINLQRQGYFVILMESVAVGDGEYMWQVKKEGMGSSFLLMAKLYPLRYAIGGLLLYFLFRQK